MTVAELIKQLSTMDPEAIVVLSKNYTRLGDGEMTITDWEFGKFLHDTDWKTGSKKDYGVYYSGNSFEELDDENKSNCVEAVYFC